MKLSRFLLVGAVALMAFAGCEKESGDTKKDNSGGTDNKTTEAYITLSDTELLLSKVGSTISVTVESNYSWGYSYDTSNGWFTIEKDEKGSFLTISYDTNDTETDRESVVTVTAGGGAGNTASAELKITQSWENFDALILEYTTTSNNTKIELPIAGVSNVIIDWDDGNTETVSSNYPSHTYSTPGIYTITINGNATRLNSTSSPGTTRSGVKYLTAVKQWGNTNLTSMLYAFCGCSNLTSLPDDYVGAFKNVTTFEDAFYGCTALVSVPENMFSRCTVATSFNHCFYNCTALTSAPSFEGCSKATDFSACFYICPSLTAIPENIFSNCPNVTDFGSCFRNCSSVVGESPYTEIEVDGEKVKVHLYERGNYAVEMRWTIPEYFSYCFTGSTFSDIDSIPSGWGGNKK